MRAALDQPFTGDFDAQVARRLIRVGVTFNRTHYFIDKGQQRGLTYEAVKLFEDELNTNHKTGNLKVNLVFVPLPRDQLYPALINGKVDAGEACDRLIEGLKSTRDAWAEISGMPKLPK